MLARDEVTARKILMPTMMALFVEIAFHDVTSVAPVLFSYSVEFAMSLRLLQRNYTWFNMYGKNSL